MHVNCQINMQKYAAFETVLHVILFALKNENQMLT